MYAIRSYYAIGRETALRLPYALAALANLGLLALALRWLPRRGAD